MRIIYIPKSVALFYPVNYGILYNGYVVADARSITSIRARIATRYDFYNLATIANDGVPPSSPLALKGMSLKEIGNTHWTINNGTDIFGFGAIGSGDRGVGQLGYHGFNTAARYRGSSVGYPWNVFEVANSGQMVFTNTDGYGSQAGWYQGYSLRAVIISTNLTTQGQRGIYVGNDLKTYETVLIGSLEWIIKPLAESRYRDGSLINATTYTDAQWNALTIEACCPPNGNWNNV